MISLLILIFAGNLAGAGELITPPVPTIQAPTITLEKTPVYPKKPKYKGPILLDARPQFDYALGHLPGAISIRWEDYSQTQEPHKGGLDPDLSLLSRKLRYLGINPEKEVIVLGLGEKGKGEEGRIAWMLEYMGVKKIKVENVLNVPGRKTVEDVARYESVPPWNPKPNYSLRVKKSDVQEILDKKPNDKFIIDVREEAVAKDKKIPGAINISWTQFVSPQGEPVRIDKVKEILAANKINADGNLIFYSENGVTSGYVTFTVSQAGLHAQNYDGGSNEWFAASGTAGDVK